MIDFHTHIIPNIDDGSRSVEETFNLIQEAQNAGFDKIISTSHFKENFYEVPCSERKAWVDALSQGISEKNMNVKLYLGNEIYFSSRYTFKFK